MIAALSDQSGSQHVQIFITHSNHKLVHMWIEDGILHSQFVMDGVNSRAYVIKSEFTYHMFLVDCKNQLMYLERKYDQEEQIWINREIALDYNINKCDPQCIKRQQYYQVFYLNRQRQLVVARISTFNQVVLKKTIVGNKITHNFRLINLNSQILIICTEQQNLVYCFLNSTCQVEWKKIKTGNIGHFIVSQGQANQQNCKIVLSTSQHLYEVQISAKQVFIQLLSQQKCQAVQSTIFLQINQQLYKIQITKNAKYKKSLFNKQKINDHTLITHKEAVHILLLDKNQLLTHYYKQGKEWKMRCQKQQLNWEDIQEDCLPIGDEGWHADAFINKKLNLIVKKMRNPNSYLINNEIYNLQYLSTFLPIKCDFRIIRNGAIGGLTLNFIPGEKWDNILDKEQNIFILSPIARILLVIKLTKIIRILQANSFCHGDLHMSNILIDIKNADLVKPQFDIEVIDFGNGFVFEQNKLVSKGLTGLTIIIPFEVQSLRKKNYNPTGINAHQLGRNALQILLLSRHSQVQQLKYSPAQQLQSLSLRSQYPVQIHSFISGLLDQNPYQRNHYLFSQIIDDLQQRTREIYLSRHRN